MKVKLSNKKIVKHLKGDMKDFKKEISKDKSLIGELKDNERKKKK